jgi:hypothetical protein
MVRRMEKAHLSSTCKNTLKKWMHSMCWWVDLTTCWDYSGELTIRSLSDKVSKVEHPLLLGKTPGAVLCLFLSFSSWPGYVFWKLCLAPLLGYLLFRAGFHMCPIWFKLRL